MRIDNLPKGKRPREKLETLGAANLSESELIALLLGSGTKKANALSVARSLLRSYTLPQLVHLELKDITSISGIGTARAATLLAGLELGRRVWEEAPVTRITTPAEVVAEVDEIRAKQREYLLAFYLNARHELLSKRTVAIGGLNQLALEARDVFSIAVSLPCAFVILVHNHPSGDPQPSEDDEVFTHRLAEAAALLGLRVTDHIIVTAKDYFSFRESGLL